MYVHQVWAIRAVADLAANNPNNQTKLGLGGACEALVDVVKVLASNKEGGVGSISHYSDGGYGVTCDLATSAPSYSLALTVTTDDAANDVGTAVDDEALAKWTVWAIGNLVRKRQYNQLFLLPSYPSRITLRTRYMLIHHHSSSLLISNLLQY